MKRFVVLFSFLAAFGCGGGGGGNKGPCESGANNCSQDATCTDTAGGFTCACKPGFLGDGVSCALDECTAALNDCSGDAICANTPGGGHTCTCKPGFAGDGFTCADVDECAPGAPLEFAKADYGSEQDCITADVCLTRGDRFSIYNAVVDDVSNGTRCSGPMPTGTLWAVGSCDSVTPLDFGPFLSDSFASCEPPTIVDQPACLELVQDHRYLDITFTAWTQGGGGGTAAGGGFAYTRSEYNPCGAGAACTNTVGAYTCECPDGFTFDGKTCVDLDECTATPGICGANSTCVNTFGSYSCYACSPGTSWDGQACVDIDECAGFDFAKSDYGTEEDWIAPGVIIARGDSGPIFNPLADAGGAVWTDAPTGTLWALGTCDSVTDADFGAFLSSSFADAENAGPPSIVDVPGCLKVAPDGQLYDITFSSWTVGQGGGGNGGGGFSYSRQAYCGPSATCSNTSGSYACVP